MRCGSDGFGAEALSLANAGRQSLQILVADCPRAFPTPQYVRLPVCLVYSARLTIPRGVGRVDKLARQEQTIAVHIYRA